LRAVGLGAIPQRSLSGSIPVSALRSIADLHLGGDPRVVAQMQAALASLYAGDDPLTAIGRETFDIFEALQARDPRGYQPTTALMYPETELVKLRGFLR
jgi:hypothetical protein